MSVKIGVVRMGGSLSAYIAGARGQLPTTPVGAERPEISTFRMVLRYWQTIIPFSRNTRIWQTDRLTELRQQYRASHYMLSHQ